MSDDPPRMTIFAVAFTCGVLLTLVARILAGNAGLTFLPVWMNQAASNHEQMLSALGWWTIAGAGFIGSFLTGLLMQDPPGKRSRATLRVILGAFLFLLLVALPYIVGGAPEVSPRQSLMADATAFGLGLVTVFCGSWFSLPR